MGCILMENKSTTFMVTFNIHETNSFLIANAINSPSLAKVSED